MTGTLFCQALYKGIDAFCESGCAYNGITDFVKNMLMKVQHVAVSENSVHDSCVPLTVIWTWNFLHSLGKRDGICMD